MNRKYLVYALVSIVALWGIAAFADCEDYSCEEWWHETDGGDCTVMLVGKDASVDGSVMNSHTGCCSNSRVHVVPAQDFEPGTMAPVYYGLQSTPSGSTYESRGEILGYIPQVESTYAYFHTGYPQMNEHQLAIGETTTSQKNELRATKGACEQIMTVEQAQLFAHQRCTTAREALDLITSLLEEYGFLPSCCGKYTDGETLTISDPNEIWVLEIFSIGNDWDPESGKPGALWAAQRVPAGHVKICPNASTIGEIDPTNPDQLVSSNYMDVAVEKGLYDPDSGEPFIWREVFAPPPTEGNMIRIQLFYQTFCPSLMKHRLPWNPLHYYPFSAKPDKKLSVQDVMGFQRHALEGTIWDMSADLDWLVDDGQGGFVKSPLCTPLPSKYMRELLDITWHRPVSSGGYAFVSQSRDWLPDAIGGVYWFTVETRAHSIYVPIYSGVSEINPIYSKWNREVFQHDSVRWAIDFVDNLLYLRYQDAIEYLKSVRDPMEGRFFADQPEIEAIALSLYEKDAATAEKYLTEYTWDCMDEVMELFVNLRYELIQKFAISTGSPSTTGGSYRGDDFVPAWPR